MVLTRIGYTSFRTAALAGVVLAAACNDGGLTANGEAGSVQVTAARTAGAALVTSLALAPAGGSESSAAIDLANVASLQVEITAIQFLPILEDEASEAAWIELAVGDPVTPVIIDLVALPVEGASPLVIAAGSVAPGEYGMVRLITGNAWIQFHEPFTVGQTEFAAGELLPIVTIPSGPQTGLKTDIAFTVEADVGGNALEVALLFDTDTSLRNAAATGNGRVIVNPVLRARVEQD